MVQAFKWYGVRGSLFFLSRLDSTSQHFNGASHQMGQHRARAPSGVFLPVTPE